MIEILVARGADLNAQNKFGNTPLHVTQTRTSMTSTVVSYNLDLFLYHLQTVIQLFFAGDLFSRYSRGRKNRKIKLPAKMFACNDAILNK